MYFSICFFADTVIKYLDLLKKSFLYYHLIQTKMKKIGKYLGVRSVRLGTLAVMVATFVGLPALGRAINTDSFEKLDAVNFLSSVILAEEYVGGEMPSTPTETSTSSYTQPTNYVPAPTPDASTVPTYTTPTYTNTQQSSYPTNTESQGSSTSNYTYPTMGTNGTYTTTGSMGVNTPPTTGTTSTSTYNTSSSMTPCTTPESCASMSNGYNKASDFTCTGENCSMTQSAQTTMQNQNSQMMNSTPTTDTKSTSTNTQYSQVEVKSEYTDYSSREEKYGEYSNLYTQAQYDPSACKGSSCGGMTQYGFQKLFIYFRMFI